MPVSVCLTFDFDAISVSIGNFHATTPSAISRGEFGVVGARRLLEMLRGWNFPSTWFIPGHTADSYPEITARIAEAGHELAHHGYRHERLGSPEEEIRDFDMAIASLSRITGQAPLGYRSPAAGLTPRTLELLVGHGMLYDSSMMGDDFTPYYCRVGDQAPKDSAFIFGRPTEVVELPFTWGLDDFIAFEHVWTRNGINPGIASPSRILEVWSGDFDYLYDRLGAGTYILTLHPQCIGRGHRLLMLERLVDHIQSREGVRFRTMREVAEEFKRAHPPERLAAAGH